MQSAFPRFKMIVALLVVGALSFIYRIQQPAPVQPATAAQPAGPVVVLAITRCGLLAGWLAVYANGKAALLPPLRAKPGTRTTAIEVDGNSCGAVL